MLHLVTGAAGFIGFHLTRRLLERGDEVVGIDSLNEYYDPALKLARLADLGVGSGATEWGTPVKSSRHKGFTFYRLALENQEGMEPLFVERRFDRVCHLAAQAGVRYSLVNPRAYIESNVMGFLNVLECCRASLIPHLVYASSSSVYGLGSVRPSSPHSPVDHPVSLYGATKRADELMAHAYSALYGLPTTGLRFFTVYGPWGRPDMAYFKFTEAIMTGRPIEVYNGGDMLRDFTFVDDVVEGIIHVLSTVPQGDPAWSAQGADPARSSAPFRIYNIGNSRPIRLDEFIRELERALGARATLRLLPMQPGDAYATEADVSDFERDFGWRPRTEIAAGLVEFVRWYKAFKSTGSREVGA